MHELSGGMRQRVALARALAQDSSVLLMDEPFAALDAITRDVLHQELTRVWAEQGLSVVFVTHNVREAVRLGQRVVLLGSRPGRDRPGVAGRHPAAAHHRVARGRHAGRRDHRASCTRRSAAMASDAAAAADWPSASGDGRREPRRRGRPRRPRRRAAAAAAARARAGCFVRSVLPPIVFLAAAGRRSGSWPTSPELKPPYALPVPGRRGGDVLGRRCRTAGPPRRSGPA